MDDSLKVAPQQRAQGGVRPDRLRQRVQGPARVGRRRGHRRWQRRQGALQGDPRIHAFGHKIIGARRLQCGFRPLLAAHSQSRAPIQGAKVKPKTANPKAPKKGNPKTTTTATPKGSVSASGWLSWPKLCWHNALCTVFICLIAGACGGAFAYFSHGSDSLLPSIVVPDATALPTETERRIDQIVRVVRPMRPLAASPRKAWSARAASKHVAVCLTGDLRVPAVTFAHIEHHLLLPSASQEVLHMDVFYVGGKTPAFQELQGRIKLRGAFTYSAVNVGGAHERAESSQTALLESITNKTNVRTMHVPTLNWPLAPIKLSGVSAAIVRRAGLSSACLRRAHSSQRGRAGGIV